MMRLNTFVHENSGECGEKRKAPVIIMGKTAMDKTSYLRQVSGNNIGKTLFPD